MKIDLDATERFKYLYESMGFLCLMLGAYYITYSVSRCNIEALD